MMETKWSKEIREKLREIEQEIAQALRDISVECNPRVQARVLELGEMLYIQVSRDSLPDLVDRLKDLVEYIQKTCEKLLDKISYLSPEQNKTLREDINRVFDGWLDLEAQEDIRGMIEEGFVEISKRIEKSSFLPFRDSARF